MLLLSFFKKINDVEKVFFFVNVVQRYRITEIRINLNKIVQNIYVLTFFVLKKLKRRKILKKKQKNIVLFAYMYIFDKQ